MYPYLNNYVGKPFLDENNFMKNVCFKERPILLQIKSHNSWWRFKPPRSPDLTYLNFYFCVSCQVNNLQCSCYNIQHLKQPIRQVVASVTDDFLGRVRQEMEYR
jgi:hypothetical protein